MFIFSLPALLPTSISTAFGKRGRRRSHRSISCGRHSIFFPVRVYGRRSCIQTHQFHGLSRGMTRMQTWLNCLTHSWISRTSATFSDVLQSSFTYSRQLPLLMLIAWFLFCIMHCTTDLLSPACSMQLSSYTTVSTCLSRHNITNCFPACCGKRRTVHRSGPATFVIFVTLLSLAGRLLPQKPLSNKSLFQCPSLTMR